MNLYELIWIKRICAAVHGGALMQAVRAACSVWQCERCERQCVAVRTVVCVQYARTAVCSSVQQCSSVALQQCAAVFLVVYGSAHGSVRLSSSKRQ
jgi:hypothetical protein